MARRRKVALTTSRLRSAVTNGSTVLSDIDHRSAWMRRLRDLIVIHVADLGGEPGVAARC